MRILAASRRFTIASSDGRRCVPGNGAFRSESSASLGQTHGSRLPVRRRREWAPSAMAVMSAISRLGDPLEFTTLRPMRLPVSSTPKTIAPSRAGRVAPGPVGSR